MVGNAWATATCKWKLLFCIIYSTTYTPGIPGPALLSWAGLWAWPEKHIMHLLQCMLIGDLHWVSNPPTMRLELKLGQSLALGLVFFVVGFGGFFWGGVGWVVCFFFYSSDAYDKWKEIFRWTRTVYEFLFNLSYQKKKDHIKIFWNNTCMFKYIVSIKWSPPMPKFLQASSLSKQKCDLHHLPLLWSSSASQLKNL